MGQTALLATIPSQHSGSIDKLFGLNPEKIGTPKPRSKRVV